MAKTIKVTKVGLKKKAGFLYFIDKQGDISMVKMNRGGRMKKKKAAKKKSAKKKTVKRKAAKKKPARKKKR